jgi:hypothetical protein
LGSKKDGTREQVLDVGIEPMFTLVTEKGGSKISMPVHEGHACKAE